MFLLQEAPLTATNDPAIGVTGRYTSKYFEKDPINALFLLARNTT